MYALMLVLIATLTGKIGTVEVQRGGQWMPLQVGEQIESAQRIRTGVASSAAVELGSGKVVTLGESTLVEIAESNGTPAVRLETGRMKVVAVQDIQVSAKDTTLQAAEKPLDLEIGYQADRLNLTVITGAVQTGPVIIRGAQDSSKRSYVADSRRAGFSNTLTYPNMFYVYPQIFYGAPVAAPAQQRNPYNGINPAQIVTPMTDPLRPPVHFPINPFPR
jgi:hypothetical protein